MAVFEHRTETTTRQVYALPNPTNWVEMEKAFSSARHALNDLGVQIYDDTIHVDADEEEILLWFEVPNAKA